MLDPASPSPPESSAAGDSAKHGASVERQSSRSRSTQDPSGSADRPTKKRSFRLMPSLSSSEPKHKQSNASLQGVAEDHPHPSQSQSGHKRRESSRGSSRRSGRLRPSDNNSNPVSSKVVTREADDNSSGERGLGSKGTSRLFAIFSCCSSSGVDQDDEPVLPAKQATNPRPIQGGRSATPVEKTVGAEPHQTKKPNNALDEKAALNAETSQHPIPADFSDNKTEAKENVALTSKDQEAQLPTTSDAPGPSNSAPIRVGSEISHPQFEPEGSNQFPLEKTSSTIDEKQTVQDSVPGQDDKSDDVVMHDVPVEDNHTTQDAATSTDEEVVRQGIPPPPPIQYATAVSESAAPSIEPEKLDYLLPPVQPEFKNRKCLVLDLDETLVHSSFKVSSYYLFQFYLDVRMLTLVRTGFGESGFHNTSRNRRTVS